MSEFNEPWKIEQRIDSDNDPYSVIVMSDGRDAIDAREYGGDCCDCSARIDMKESDLIRIAACVNFCRNLRTEWLEDHLAVENPPYPGRTAYMEPNKLRPVFETDKIKVRMRLEGE